MRNARCSSSCRCAAEFCWPFKQRQVKRVMEPWKIFLQLQKNNLNFASNRPWFSASFESIVSLCSPVYFDHRSTRCFWRERLSGSSSKTTGTAFPCRQIDDPQMRSVSKSNVLYIFPCCTRSVAARSFEEFFQKTGTIFWTFWCQNVKFFNLKFQFWSC